MKQLTLSIALIFSLFTFAQNDDFFKISDSKLIWQKVYETTKNKEQIITHFKESEQLFSFRVLEDTIFGILKPQAIDPKVKGVAGVPAMVNKCKYKGTVKIEARDKKYRVTFSELTLVGDGEILKKNSTQTFEESYLKKDTDQYRPFFLKKPTKIYNYWFNTVFEIKEKVKDEW